MAIPAGEASDKKPGARKKESSNDA
jgi:hypothetical protein